MPAHANCWCPSPQGTYQVPQVCHTLQGSTKYQDTPLYCLRYD
jgi:hypothetical protein